MSAHLGRRLRKGATSGAVVAAAVAALAASQAPEMTPPPTDNAGGDRAIGAGDTASPSGDGSATGNSPYYTELPPLNPPSNPGLPAAKLPVITGPAQAGIPASVLAAYQRAEQSIRSTTPGCNLPWQLLAGIGKVESGQASGGRVDANGTTLTPILGPVLNGVGFANISDTDGGAFDGDRTHDRAVGPMQFIPSTWATWGQDANSDGKKDPNNIYDAAQAAGLYLCANDRNLALKADLDRAILSYNRSTEYLNTVMSWFEYYRRGTHQVPDGTGVLPVDRSDGRGQDNRPLPTTPAPTTPAPKPSGTGTPKPDPTKPGGPSATKPPTKPTPPLKPPVTPPTKPPVPPTVPPAVKVARLAAVTSGPLTATTESAFTKSPTVAALDAAGAPITGVSIRFEITGTTDTRFSGGATTATVTTGSAGIAAAPTLRAGEKTGSFTVKATVVGRGMDATAFAATVTARQADTLARIGGDPLSATTGTTFGQSVQVKATDKGALAPGVLVTVVIADAAGTTESTGGPSFKDGVRTLVLKTDENGLISLPEILAGDKAGEYVLRLTAPGGGDAEIKLTVTAPTATPSPSPTPEPTPSGTGSPEASPSPSA
ncbi:lytic transglycosylase domain-containing protein [Streptomyces sp. TX20-6-3]|uniref:lytic transglycosylase domain-containing protein n=1 Tax=Streptomyces sp. TX20-6-3 TaxID=3028705 RepID=UPI0029A6DB69|nr:lytic transglycosylase domain-containing protein [Streptomyces sp. TX20-6-3]MDX2558221.1 lytic transglycosylase domain-containing protein [Streptomyces sp. TX20-6-3]